MRFSNKIQLWIFVLVVAGGCSTKDVGVTIAECHEKAHAMLGIKGDNIAPTEYLIDKAEAVRVCAVKNGLKFNSSRWANDWGLLMQSNFNGNDPKRVKAIMSVDSKYWLYE